MSSRIVVFGATGYTGRLVAERLVARGERPVLAGRDERRLAELSERLGGLETVKADAMRRNSVFAAVGPGDVLISTVGPFAKWGDAAVRAAIAASGAVYLDSTGEPVFIRRVFEELGGAGRARRGDADARDGLRLRARAPWRARWRCATPGRPRPASTSATSRSGWAPTAPARARASRSWARRSTTTTPSATGRCARCARPSACARSTSRARRAARSRSAAPSTSRSRPPTPRLLEVNVYLGWFGPLAKPMQAGALAGTVALKLPGVRSVLQAAGERLVSLAGAPEPGTTPDTLSWIAAVAYDAAGEPLAEVHVTGTDAYDFTASFMAWAAQRAAGGNRPHVVGAAGPVEAFGLDALEAGCAEAGLRRAQRGRRSSVDTRSSPRASGPVGRSSPSAVTSNGGLAGRWKSFQRTRSSARAGPNARGSGSRHTPQRGALERVASRIPLTARRAASLAASIVARSVWVRT